MSTVYRESFSVSQAACQWGGWECTADLSKPKGYSIPYVVTLMKLGGMAGDLLLLVGRWLTVSEQFLYALLVVFYPLVSFLTLNIFISSCKFSNFCPSDSLQTSHIEAGEWASGCIVLGCLITLHHNRLAGLRIQTLQCWSEWKLGMKESCSLSRVHQKSDLLTICCCNYNDDFCDKSTYLSQISQQDSKLLSYTSVLIQFQAKSGGLDEAQQILSLILYFNIGHTLQVQSIYDILTFCWFGLCLLKTVFPNWKSCLCRILHFNECVYFYFYWNKVTLIWKKLQTISKYY